MKICLIGAGRIGIVHAIAIASEQNATLHSVVDVNQEAADSLAKKYSAEVLTIDVAMQILMHISSQAALQLMLTL